MITTAAEYEKYLSQIYDVNPPTLAVLLPSSEPIYKINLNKRTVEVPDFLSVEKDHRAECLYFIVDRFFDNIDLATTTCVIQYINAGGESRVYAVPYYDVTTYNNPDSPKMLIPWAIGGEATKYAGDVTFSFRFYKLNKVLDEKNPRYFTYNLSTRPTKGKVLYGLDIKDLEASNYLADKEEEIYARIAALESLNWIDL